ncbi:MAG: hypothetical protein H7839_14420 [Magnetococcus sp. YQC-5]
MYRSLLIITFILMTLLLTGAPQTAWSAVDHDHNEPKKNESGLTLNNGKPWSTDAPLRKGMEQIQIHIQEALPRIHAGTQTNKQYATLAKKIHSHINTMIKQCKLPPDADAQLHVVLGEVIKGALTMQEQGGQASGAAKIVHALDLYGRHFDHAGWKPITH